MSEEPTFDAQPPLGYRRQDRFDTCGYNPTMAEGLECGKPATWHIIWTMDVENGAACDQHAQQTRERWVYAGLHRRGPDCMMPGSVWIAEEDRCVVEGETAEEPELVAARSLPAGVSG